MRSLLVLPFLMIACGSESTSPSANTTPDTGTNVAVDSAHEEDSMAPSTDSATPGDDAPLFMDAGCTACATLKGKVMRKALTKPQHGGKGNVYVAVFDHDPVIDRMNAKLVGQALIMDADMTADTASVDYAVKDITPRADPYFVIAFLDDNHNASTASPGPDKGDLVSLEGLSSPKVTLATPTVATLDLALSAALPF
jgi:hypothetical protein